MSSLEVRKGSSQIKYGPRTNGGVLNLVSTKMPDELRLAGSLSGGSQGTRRLHANLGDSYKRFGWLVETYQLRTDGFKQLDGGGDTGFSISDYMAKLRFHSSPGTRRYQALELKLARTDQPSNETYLGLTDPDFALTPLRRYAGSQADRFESEHRQYQLTYFVALSPRVDFTTVVYRNDFHRNWYKLQSVLGNGLSGLFEDPEAHAGELAVARGADSDPDALIVRANNRSYRSQGVQSVLGAQAESLGALHQVELGVRYHEDEEDRFQHQDGFQMLNGRMRLTNRGAPGSQSNRLSAADAWALFIQDRIEWDRFTLTPGIRFESIDLLRTDFSGSDPERTEPTRVRPNSLNELIPGIGADYGLRPGLHVFGGVHKGFSPPGPGSTEDTRAEKSVNYELGLRRSTGSLSAEAIGFYSDYSNLLGVDTLSSGGTGHGELYNGGEVRVMGLEAALSADLLGGSGRLALPLQISYTFTDAQFRNTFESGFEPWGSVEADDELPYLPNHQVFAGLALQSDRFRFGFEVSYVSRMRAQAGQGPIPHSERTDARLVLNLTAEFALGAGFHAFGNVQNLTDASYVVARRPAGVRPGLPRSLFAGVRFDLSRD